MWKLKSGAGSQARTDGNYIYCNIDEIEERIIGGEKITPDSIIAFREMVRLGEIIR